MSDDSSYLSHDHFQCNLPTVPDFNPLIDISPLVPAMTLVHGVSLPSVGSAGCPWTCDPPSGPAPTPHDPTAVSGYLTWRRLPETISADKQMFIVFMPNAADDTLHVYN